MHAPTVPYFERQDDVCVVALDTQGFDLLSPSQKKLAYHLTQAGLWGRRIAQDQGSALHLPLLDALVDLFDQLEPSDPLHPPLQDTLFLLFAHNGIYHSTTGERLALPISRTHLEQCSLPLARTALTLLFETPTAAFKTVQTEGQDVVAASGSNFYQNLTTAQVQQWRSQHHPSAPTANHSHIEQTPPHAFHERLVGLPDGTIERQLLWSQGRHGTLFTRMMQHLTQALAYTENVAQHESIKTLIDSFGSPDPKDFDTHCVAWVKDTESSIFFILGLIESYDDPLGAACTFESIVAFKNPLQTAKVHKIIENIQWFEDHLPFDHAFKKEKAQGLSASSISVIGMAGDASPILPLGVNLPNSDWIRQVHGSKSVNLHNVASGRSVFDTLLRNELYLPQYHSALEQYAHITDSLHTDLHEIAGHGSGKLLPNVSPEALGAYYSTMEEARADLVGLYYIADPMLQHFGIFDPTVDVQQAAIAAYVSYLTNGALGQLRRVTLGNELTQPHMRNRHLIAHYVLSHADPKAVRLVEHADGKLYIELHDVQHMRRIIGDLLAIVQRIKSTGDAHGAKHLVMTYGTKVHPQHHAQMIARIEKLNIPKTMCFLTPILHLTPEGGVSLAQPSDFLTQQLHLHRTFKEDAPFC